MQAQLRPPDVVHAPGPVAGQVRCRFGPRFGIETSTEVVEATPPSGRGWRARLPPAVLNNAPACAGKTDVPVTLRGHPSDQHYQQTVHNSEMEHVHALEALHNRHFVPYYRFVTGLSATPAPRPTAKQGSVSASIIATSRRPSRSPWPTRRKRAGSTIPGARTTAR